MKKLLPITRGQVREAAKLGGICLAGGLMSVSLIDPKVIFLLAISVLLMILGICFLYLAYQLEKQRQEEKQP